MRENCSDEKEAKSSVLAILCNTLLIINKNARTD